MTDDTRITVFSPALADRVAALTAVAAAQEQVKAAVEANHDDNRWWPAFVTDPRVRMAVAGWSSRVSYSMIDTYAAVVKATDADGWDLLTGMDDTCLTAVVRPLGLSDARVRYLRSLEAFLDRRDLDKLLAMPAGEFVEDFAAQVDGASYKTAQCAALYSRGYHCGIIPVDSGMVTLLGPLLGLRLENGPQAHEQMRLLLEACATTRPTAFRDLADQRGHAVTIPGDTAPTWWLHLVLIYFKRLFLNRPASPRLCTLRPACADLLDCSHTEQPT